MSISGSLSKAASPYAEALFESSQFIKMTDKTTEDLKLVNKTIQQSNVLKTFLANPLVVNESKKTVLSQLFIDQVSPHVLNFLSILIDRRRIILLDSIVSCYLDLVYQVQLTTVAFVYTAVMLTDSQKQCLGKKLQLMTGSKNIQLIMNIKPELIGGLIVKIGSKIIDMSISGQLNKISLFLNGARL